MKFTNLFFLTFFIFSTYLCALNSLENLVLWGPKDESQLLALQKLIEQEDIREPGASFDRDGDGKSRYDFGYSYGKLSAPLLDCLKQIKKQNKAQILDIGAGTGLVGWKLITAGAHYHAVEISKENAQKVLQRVNAVKNYIQLNDNEQFKERVKIVRGDFLEAPTRNKFQKGSYDYIWVSNFIHYINVNKINETLKNIHELLAEHGIAYVITSAPSGSKGLIDLYSSNRQKQLAYPGYVAINKTYYTWHKPNGNPEECGWAFDSWENIIDNALPGANGGNKYSFRNMKFMIMPLSEELKKKIDPNLVKEKITGHQQYNVFNYIDLPELKKWVCEANFSIIDSYYIGENGERLDEAQISDFYQIPTVFSVVKIKKVQ